VSRRITLNHHYVQAQKHTYIFTARTLKTCSLHEVPEDKPIPDEPMNGISPGVWDHRKAVEVPL